jgi:UDP-N-acetylmuramoyl-tripeptide--D-alanyl-D-alanine ligase
LFVSLVGENHDAHDHLAAAIAAGAAALVVSQPESAGLSDCGVPVFVVDDTTVALGKLAGYRRRAWGPGKILVGITGTNGKTSTRALTTAALASRLEVHATSGNFNNRIGLPLTLLATPDYADVAVVEMGTSLPGEIALLSAVAQPEVAVVTSVAEGHLEGLGSLGGVMSEKTSIFSGVRVAVAPASQPEIAVRAARITAGTVITAGLGEGTFSADKWGANPDGSGWLEVLGARVDVPLRGEHNLRNAMLSLAVARELGVSLHDAANGIRALPAQSMRMETTSLRGGAVVLINDAYNSNPGSAVAAIEHLASLKGGGQRVLILGGMRELGAASAELHEKVARAALEADLQIIAGIGDFEAAFTRVAPADQRVVTVRDVGNLWKELGPRVTLPCTIMLKASRGIRLEQIVPEIERWAGA